MEVQLHGPVAFRLRKEPIVRTGQRDGWAVQPVCPVEKNYTALLSGIEP
jgi:hypothetical protein